MYYTVSGIITPIGGRPVHRLREDLCIKFVNFQDYTEMHGQRNIKPQNKFIIASNSKAYYLSTIREPCPFFLLCMSGKKPGSSLKYLKTRT